MYFSFASQVHCWCKRGLLSVGVQAGGWGSISTHHRKSWDTEESMADHTLVLKVISDQHHGPTQCSIFTWLGLLSAWRKVASDTTNHKRGIAGSCKWQDSFPQSASVVTNTTFTPHFACQHSFLPQVVSFALEIYRLKKGDGRGGGGRGRDRMGQDGRQRIFPPCDQYNRDGRRVA